VIVTVIMILIAAFFPVQFAAEAAGVAKATYTAPDGFKVISYSDAWKDTDKLKSVYEELLRNKHGEEFKLLDRIYIYPEPDVDWEEQNQKITRTKNFNWRQLKQTSI